MIRSLSSTLTLAALAVSVLSTPALALPPAGGGDIELLLAPGNALPASPTEPTMHPPEDGRACRGDLFTISVPVGRDIAPAQMDRAIAAVEQGLVDLFTRDPSFAPRPIQRVAIDRVLPGNHRHWLLGPIDNGGRRVRVNPARLCEVIAEIRRIAVGEVGDILSIGRDCETAAQSDWHETAMTPAVDPFAPAMALNPSWAQPARHVRVAVIDGPMSHAGMAWSNAQSSGARATVSYPHADAMARLVREMAPAAEIVGYPALVDGAMGTPISAVARALHRALADRPHVINLSLGWPSEMGRPIELRGRKAVTQPGGGVVISHCETIEDPAGEAVRELLGSATDAGVVVVAAAGNRVGPQPLDGYHLLKPYNAYPRLFPCRGAAAVHAGLAPAYGELFFPAAWSQVPTCVNGQAGAVQQAMPGPMPIVAVGAFGRHGEPTLGDATLFAPGIGVSLAPVPTALSQRLPARMTGTSVAAAVTSGAIARLMAGALLLDPVGALRAGAVSCGSGPERFLRRCVTQPLPQMTPRAARSTLTAGARPFQAVNGAPLVLDKASAAGLGPQPEIDPCDDDCRFMARPRTRTGRVELRMRFGAHVSREISTAEIEVRKGKLSTRYTLASAVTDAMNSQLRTSSKVALDLTDVPVVVYQDQNGKPTPLNDGLESDMAIDLVFTVTVDNKQTTRRRSRLVPGYLP